VFKSRYFLEECQFFKTNSALLYQIIFTFSLFIHFVSVLDIDFPTTLILFGSFSVFSVYLLSAVYMSCLLPCNLCLYVVLFLYIANWLLNLQINSQEIN